MKEILLITILTATFFAFNADSNEMKKTEFIKSNLTTSEDIAKLEAITGKDLPEWYVEHYMQLSGLKRAELKDHELDDNSHVDFTAVFEDGGADGDHITDFMSLEQIKQAWPYIDYLEDDVENFEISSNFVQWEYLFPLAGTGDGTIYVAIGGDHNRKVYEADNGDYGIGRVSNDIDDFVTSLGIKVKTE